MIKDPDQITRANIDKTQASIQSGAKQVREEIDMLETSMAVFAKTKAEAERVAAEKAACEQAERERKAQEARIELERQAKVKELARKRQTLIDANDPISMEHKLLVERFEDCVKKVTDAYADNMLYLNSLENDARSDDHDYLEGCSAILYHNANEIFASNYWEMSNTMLSQLVTALDRDLELLAQVKDMFVRKNEEPSAPAFRVQRLPRKKLRYWQNQMESSNPYVALIAMSKIEAHKLRVKRGVIAHQTNNRKN